MKLSEISKEEFHTRLKDPRPQLVRKQIEKFRKKLEPFGVEVKHNEKPYYDGVWSMTAMYPDAPSELHQKILTAYYGTFSVNHFETENKLSILSQDQGADYMRWTIHFNPIGEEA